ncbi:hypothetical protein H6P81_001342 [Aristolochia fimbriata]|uniref:Uncharacterized protein n=1 Tax=Aristolochia fimbriata TaxID=158543 RepID=A0AAV7F891_ARIFI|nr:hypothetical protein H6P81_001342 [Aristolochia fimbriata]
MLLAVEGGGFFSSSASGYSKGLTLLLLGRRTEERPMKVAPWNQYQLVDREPDPDFQLAPRKFRISRGCASFMCFHRASAGLDGPSPPKVGPVHHPDSSQESPSIDNDENNHKKVSLKSNLKKSPNRSVEIGVGEHDLSSESHEVEKRRVQWTDTCGGELVEVREFEVSSCCASEEAFEDERDRSCGCVIQ